MDDDMFFGILIFDPKPGFFMGYSLTQSHDFAWAIAFARWPIFKILLFLQYLVFFRAVFCTEKL